MNKNVMIIDGAKYVAVKVPQSYGCSGCAFKSQTQSATDPCAPIKCLPHEREDKQYVIWVKACGVGECENDVTIDGVKYVAAKAKNAKGACNGCAFLPATGHGCLASDAVPPCWRNARKDRRTIVWIKSEEK